MAANPSQPFPVVDQIPQQAADLVDGGGEPRDAGASGAAVEPVADLLRATNAAMFQLLNGGRGPLGRRPVIRQDELNGGTD